MIFLNFFEFCFLLILQKQFNVKKHFIQLQVLFILKHLVFKLSLLSLLNSELLSILSRESESDSELELLSILLLIFLLFQFKSSK